METEHEVEFISLQDGTQNITEYWQIFPQTTDNTVTNHHVTSFLIITATSVFG